MSVEKNLSLKNRNGELLSVILRKYHYGDETGMIECIRDEYGDTYSKAEWYSKAAIMEKDVKGHDIFIIAQLPQGEIAGITAFVKTAGKICTTYEIEAQVIKKKYRGYGISQNIFEYGLELLQNRDYAAVYSYPVLFHDITQRRLGSLGLKAAGIMPGIVDLKVLHHSYDDGRNTKMPLGIQVKSNCSQSVGNLYIPDRHKDFCAQRYEELGVEYEIVDSPEDNYGKMPAKGRIFYQYNRKHHYLEISILTIGADLLRQLKLLLFTFPLKGKNTANVFLNSNNRYAVKAYNWLVDEGFFFTGIKPLCGDGEYMIMHHTGETPFYPEDLKLNMEFGNIAKYIIKEKKYESR